MDVFRRRLKRPSWSCTSRLGLVVVSADAPVLMVVYLPAAPEVYDGDTVNRTLVLPTGIALLCVASRFANPPEKVE